MENQTYNDLENEAREKTKKQIQEQAEAVFSGGHGNGIMDQLQTESVKEAQLGDLTLRHEFLNNFKSAYRGYPFAGNAMVQAMATEGITDDTIIAVGVEQINAMLTSFPFDPENHGFKMQLNDKKQRTYVSVRDNDTTIILRKAHDENTGMWSLISRSADGKKTYFPEFPVFFPNDMVARMALTALGITPRKDLGDDGKGCHNDSDKDGICPVCENMGKCIGIQKKVTAERGEFDYPIEDYELADVIRISKILAEKGIDISTDECAKAWRKRSDAHDATFLIPPDSDEQVFLEIKEFLPNTHLGVDEEGYDNSGSPTDFTGQTIS